ncbi:MAG TPA: ABC transporter substrate-binding protein [Chloroflexia bacterium]|nr:ABC transporter substrate-binding protein [Chloroflexia bacterium]
MPDPSYHNFDLFFQREGDAYRVRADSAEGQASSTFIPPFSDIELQNFILTTRPGMRGVRRIDSPDVAAAKRFGGTLFQAVFNGDVQGCWRSSLSASAQQDTRIRMRLRFTDTPELADLPWEYLFSTSLNRFLALDDELAIVRYLDMPERTRPVAVTLPLRVLVMISNPGDFPRLDVEQEWAQIQEALGPLEERGLVHLDLLDDATLPVLRKKLQSAPYHILHFIGHGAFDRQTQEGVVVLKDESGRGRMVSGQQLGWLLHNYRTLALVILNACEGARADRTDPFSGTAQSLVQQGIPAVVAMQFEITDGAAKTFSQAFYAAIAGGHPVENALFEARMAIFTENHALEWATPVLYTRAADGHLFDFSSLPAPPPIVTSPLTAPDGPSVAAPEAPLATDTQVEPNARPPILEDAAIVSPQLRQVESAAASPQTSPVSTLYREAQEANKKGDWETAIEKARGALALDDGHLGAATILRDALKEKERARLQDVGPAQTHTDGLTEAMAAISRVREKLPSDSDVNDAISSLTGQSADAAKRAAIPEQSAPATKATAAGAGGTGRIAGIAAVAGLVALAVLALIFLIKPGDQNAQVSSTPTPLGLAAAASATEVASLDQSTATIPGVAEANDTATPSSDETAEPTSDSSVAGTGTQGILRVRMTGMPENIDPQRTDGEGIGIASLAYEPLLGLNDKLEVVPAAAESWEVSADGLRYTIKLRDNLSYSDGTPLTAGNFVYAWKRLLDPRINGRPYSYLAYDIAGASELDSTPATDTAKIEELMDNLGVKAIDDQHIMFTLQAPASYFPYILTLWVGDPVRQDLVEQGSDSWASDSDGLYYIGNGPFILKQYNDQGISLGANYNYRLGSPKINEIDGLYIADPSTALEAFRAGQVDAFIVPSSIYSGVFNDPQFESELIGNEGNCTTYFAFNTTHAPFNDPKVRQAIARALDRDNWDQAVLYGGGQQALSLIPSNERGYAPEANTLSFDPTAAKSLLESAGFASGQDFPTVTLQFPSDLQQQMEWLQTQLKDNLGVDVDLQTVDNDTFNTLLNEQSTVPGIFLINQCVIYPDPHAWLTVGFNSSYGPLFTGWIDEEFDRLTNQADVQPDETLRLDLYRQAHERLLTQASIIPMNYSATVSLVKPDITGVADYPSFEQLIIPGSLNIENIEVGP